MTKKHLDAMIKKGEVISESKTSGSTVNIVYKKISREYKVYKLGNGLTQTGKANYLGLIVFAIAVGKIAGSLGSEGKVFIEFVTTFNKIVTRLVITVMWYVCTLILLLFHQSA